MGKTHFSHRWCSGKSSFLAESSLQKEGLLHCNPPVMKEIQNGSERVKLHKTNHKAGIRRAMGLSASD